MNMKTIISTLAFMTGLLSLNAQTTLELQLNHKFNGADFQYGTVYELEGNAVEFTRVQYYLSGFELTHDGGQTLNMPDTYVLASGNISSYSLGQENVTTVEGVSFDLGVDAVRNGMGTTYWPNGHPLTAQTPSMDWSWPSGYFFWVIEGRVDDTGDGVPNKIFEFHALGDHLLRDVDPFTGWSLSGSTVTIDLYVNIADWLLGIDLASVGISHNGGQNNVAVADNTNPQTVFTTDAPLGINDVFVNPNSIYADYTMAYAPTIYYDLATTDPVDIRVVDMTGAVVLEADAQQPEGNYFIRKELPDGAYFIRFSNGALNEQFRFVVRN